MNEAPPSSPTAPAAVLAGGAPAEPRVGDRVGPYRLVALLGTGTGGRVFQVVHEKLGRPAALKLLSRVQAARPAARARFLAEALAAGSVDHPHIVQVTDVVEATDHAALVMELLEGQSLGAAMAAPLAPERFLPILQQVCEALAAAHAAGFVHRDLKPENVFLCTRPDGSDFVKLLDFGVATTFSPPAPASDSSSSSGERRGAFVGTPAYVAPEQASGALVDHTADLYAVGVMLYEVACGRLPYEGWTAGQFLIQHLSAPVPRLPADMRATPLGQALDAVVQRCMAKRPADRVASAGELASTFAALARGDFATARATIAPLPSPGGRARSLVILRLLGLLAGAVLAVGTIVWLLGRSEAVPVPPRPAMRAVATSMTAPAFVTLSFSSEPPGAEVRRAVGGELLGVTPFSRAFARAPEEWAVEVALAGHTPVRLSVSVASTRAISVTLARPRASRRAHRLGSEKTIDPFRR